MLSTLHIENIAVIEQAEISFDSGFNVVGNHHNCYIFFAIEICDNFVHFCGSRRVKTRNRLIQEEHLRSGAKRSGKQNSLLLAAGKVAVAMVSLIVNSEFFHIVKRSLLLHT